MASRNWGVFLATTFKYLINQKNNFSKQLYFNTISGNNWLSLKTKRC